ncbi:hypothetical protein EMCRGX_G014296 [Ephydatia muelleri]
MQVIRASNSCHGKLWLLKAGNPRRTFPLRSVFSTFPTDRKFEFKLEIKGGGATFCRAAISIWDTTAAPGLLDDWNLAHPVKIPFGWEGLLHECLLVDHLTFVVGCFASVKKRPYTLHRWFTFITWIPIQYCPFYSLKKTHV